LKTYAIGDIHGNYKQLLQLLGHINYNDAEDRLIFLGDVIDRGPGSRLVMEFLMELNKEGRHIFLRGNHEDFVLSLAEGNSSSLYVWLNEGGRACMRSYAIPDHYIDQVGLNFYYRVRDHNRQFVSEHALNDPKQLREFIRMVFPDAHMRFIRSMPVTAEVGDYLFVHEHTDALQTDKIVISGHEHLFWPFVGPKRICLGLNKNRIAALDIDSLIATTSEGTTHDIPQDILLGAAARDYFRPSVGGAWET